IGSTAGFDGNGRRESVRCLRATIRISLAVVLLVLVSRSAAAAETMALKMKLAIQVPGERITLDVQQDTTVASLRDLIAGKAQIPSSRQKIMAGYPPRALSPSRNGETLESVGVRDGDMLRVCKTAARTFSRKIIPADNACLFNSVAFCLEGGRSDMAPELRALIAGVVLSDPEGYCEAVLGKPPREYWWALVNPRHSTLSIQPSTFNPQHSTLNIQPSTFNPQHSTLNIQPSAFNPQHSTLSIQPSAFNPQLSTLNIQP
ncbi:hypothetical protein T484DRAFT_2746985, partial [Baffinella frigidus]